MPPTATPRAHSGRLAARSSLALRCLTTGALASLAVGARALGAQTLDDAEMLQPRELHATAMYGHDAWNQYWEGGLKRSNGNVGTVSTSSVTVSAGYGVTRSSR